MGGDQNRTTSTSQGEAGGSGPDSRQASCSQRSDTPRARANTKRRENSAERWGLRGGKYEMLSVVATTTAIGV